MCSLLSDALKKSAMAEKKLQANEVAHEKELVHLSRLADDMEQKLNDAELKLKVVSRKNACHVEKEKLEATKRKECVDSRRALDEECAEDVKSLRDFERARVNGAEPAQALRDADLGGSCIHDVSDDDALSDAEGARANTWTPIPKQ